TVSPRPAASTPGCSTRWQLPGARCRIASFASPVLPAEGFLLRPTFLAAQYRGQVVEGRRDLGILHRLHLSTNSQRLPKQAFGFRKLTPIAQHQRKVAQRSGHVGTPASRGFVLQGAGPAMHLFSFIELAKSAIDFANGIADFRLNLRLVPQVF